MRQTISIQVQAVLYNNDKEILNDAMRSLENAIRVYKTRTDNELYVTLFHGDASPKVTYNTLEIENIKQRFEKTINYQYIYFNENTGFPKGHNLLAKESNADYILVINPDIFFSPRFFVEMLEVFNSDKENKVGIVEGRQTPIEHPKSYNPKTGETSWASGACMMLKTSDFNIVGGFDDKTFFMYCEDVDISWKIRLQGKKIIYQPLAPVFHAKRLDKRVSMQPTETEIYCSAESGIMLAYKWSREDISEAIYQGFMGGNDEIYLKAAKVYAERKENHMLPKQLDSEHKVGTFVKGNYAKHRFVM